MKKILFVAALLLTGATLVVAETIAEVYYNPSRLGSYEVLKVTDSLNMEGALETASMRINSSDAGQVTISASQKNNSYAFGANGITYGVDVQGRIDMNTAAFVKNSVLNVFLHDGGSAEFKGSGVTSTIGTLGKANDGWAGKLEAGSGGLQAATVNV
ncbi:MAG: hypothetical protein J6U96_00785, partial [Elusimicrobiaceae bacterium]|nr:hypothetical protein [Elusimicrobiaceae bacterium]